MDQITAQSTRLNTSGLPQNLDVKYEPLSLHNRRRPQHDSTINRVVNMHYSCTSIAEIGDRYIFHLTPEDLTKNMEV
jgi:hypothetical protein